MDGSSVTLDLGSAPPALREGLAYWDRARGARSMPARAEIEPRAIVRILPNLMLLDVLREPLDFRYRLVGTRIDHYAADRYTGKRMSEVPHQRPPSQFWSECRFVVEHARPTFNRTPYVGAHRDFLSVVNLICPLGEDDNVTTLMCVLEFMPKEDPF